MNTTNLTGKEAIAKAYHANFFAITSNLSLMEASYDCVGLKARITCKIDEDKVDLDGETRRYRMGCNIELLFRIVDNNLKIAEMSERTSKDLISPLEREKSEETMKAETVMT